MRRFGWMFVALFAFASNSLAQDSPWKVGLAEVKITPSMPLPLSGYGGRTKPFEKVAGDLYVKAMMLEDAQGQRGVIVTSDLLGFSAAVAEPICERIGKRTGMKREQILLNSSHTHAGPMLTLQSKADAPAESLRAVEYTRDLMDKVVDVVASAAEKLEPAKLSLSVGVIHFAMNRREFTPDRIILGVNPRGLADRSVPVLRVEAAGGDLRCVLFGAATHGTTLGGDNYQLCGDYAGFAQAELQTKHPRAKVLFMLGCAGDSNPYPRGTMDLAKQHGKTLANEVERVLAGKFQPVTGPLAIAFARAEAPLQKLTKSELEKIVKDKRDSRSLGAGPMLAALEAGKTLPTHYPAPVAVWQFGSSLTLVGLSGEVVVDYVTMLEKTLGPNNLWIAAYCNDVFGYLPSARVLSEGGYETRGLYSGGPGLFAVEAEQVIVRTVRDLSTKVGRK